MSHSSTNKNLFDRYLHLLGLVKKEPNLKFLKELVKAHLIRIPFENISKIYYKKNFGLKWIPDLNMYLDGIETYNFGGTCYSNNYYLNLLLDYSGFDVKICGADMNNPDVHIVNLVSTEGQEYIIDGGYGAPFLVPLPRNLNENFVIPMGNINYIVRPRDTNKCSKVEMYENGEIKHGYLVKPFPRKIGDFANVIEESFKGTATFFNSLLLTRFFENKTIIIHNFSMTEYKGSELKNTDIKSREELAAQVQKIFNIPEEITRLVLDELPRLKDAWV